MRFFLCILPCWLIADLCYFIPPKGWEAAQLKNPSAYVQVGFIGKGSTDFRPCINLATEEVDVSLSEYVKAVKELQSPDAKWRDLGKLPMAGGPGRLVEMQGNSPWGEVKLLQAFFVKDNMAYILTAAVLKPDFADVHAQLLQAFRSLTVIEDLFSPVQDAKKKADLKNTFAHLSETKDLEGLQKQIETLSDLGGYWQFLAAQEAKERLSKTAP